MKTIWTVMRFTVGIITIVCCLAAALSVVFIPKYVFNPAMEKIKKIRKGNEQCLTNSQQL